MYSEKKNYPKFKVKDGSISAAVFDGQYGFSVSLQKYIVNPQTGEKRNDRIFLNSNDLLKVAFVVQRAKAWLSTQPDRPKQPNAQQPQQGYQSQQPPQETPNDGNVPF